MAATQHVHVQVHDELPAGPPHVDGQAITLFADALTLSDVVGHRDHLGGVG